MKASDGHEQPGDRWHLSVLPTLVLVRSANDAGGLDIHSVNAASAASYAQTEWKEASTAAQSGRTKGTALFLPVLPTPLRGYCFAVR